MKLYCTRYWPLGYTTTNDSLQLNFILLIPALWNQQLKQFSVYLTTYLPSLYIIVLSLNMSWDSAESLAIIVKVNNIHFSSLIHQASHLTVEGYGVQEAWLPFHKFMLTSPSHLPVLNVFWNGFQDSDFSAAFLGIEMKLFLFSFLKIGMTLVSLQSLGTSLDHHSLVTFQR